MKSLLLEPDEYRAAARRLGELLCSYEETLADRPVFPELNREALASILTESLPEAGRPIDALFDELRDLIIPNSTQIAHPRFLAYILASPTGVAPFAEAVAATLNQNCNLWTLSPAATAIELKVISWFLDLFGFKEGGGIITSGGSMANLSALAVARDRQHPGDPRGDGIQTMRTPLVLYASEETHNSLDKAAAILGIGLRNLRRIPSDEEFRIRLDLLRERVHKDRQEGLLPFCVVGNAGTVTTGAIDPIEELAEFCSVEDLWLHVDGAYGAFAILSRHHQEALSSIQRADSLTLDPHKLLFMPLEAGCVLFRDTAEWRKVFSFVPTYLSMPDEPSLLHFAEYGPQLSRGFKALKIWWSLRAFGRRAYMRAIEHVLDLASYMGESIRAHPAFELMAPIGLTAVCFRLRDWDDARNEAALSTLVSGGVAFLGPARVKGRFALRACFTNLRTSRGDVDLILEELLRVAEAGA